MINLNRVFIIKKMTKLERISIVYLLIISTASVILNLVILNKKALQPPKSTPVQTQAELITKTADSIETAAASDSANLAGELVAIHNELSMIRATQRGQSQTLGDSDTEDLLLEENNVPTPPAISTAKLTPATGLLTLRSLANAEVHKEKINSSAIVGRIYYGKNYSYFQKQDNWYLLKQEDFQGWINSNFVKEIN